MNVWRVSTLLLGVAVAVLVASTIAGAHDGGAGLIHSCVKENGAITIVGPNDSCRSTERALDWNQQGAPGVSGYEKIETSSILPVMAANTLYPVQAFCSEGKKILGGGAYVQSLPPQVAVLGNHPERGVSGNYWNGAFVNTGGDLNNVELWVVAICATVAP